MRNTQCLFGSPQDPPPSPQTPSWLQGGHGTRTGQSRHQVLLATGPRPGVAKPEPLTRHLEGRRTRRLPPRPQELGGRDSAAGTAPPLGTDTPPEGDGPERTAPEHLNPAPPRGTPQPLSSRDQHAPLCRARALGSRRGPQAAPPETDTAQSPRPRESYGGLRVPERLGWGPRDGERCPGHLASPPRAGRTPTRAVRSHLQQSLVPDFSLNTHFNLNVLN